MYKILIRFGDNDYWREAEMFGAIIADHIRQWQERPSKRAIVLAGKRILPGLYALLHTDDPQRNLPSSMNYLESILEERDIYFDDEVNGALVAYGVNRDTVLIAYYFSGTSTTVNMELM